MKDKKLLNTSEARALVKKKIGIVLTKPTMIAWIRDVGLGYKLGGRWWVASEKLIAYLEGKK